MKMNVKLNLRNWRLVVVDRSFEQSLQNACRNLPNEGLKIKFESMSTKNTKKVQVAPTTGIGKATEVVNCAVKKVNHALYRGEVFSKFKKGKPFIKVITLTLLSKFNLLFQFSICKVNDFDLKQYLLLAQYAYIYLCNMKIIYRKLYLWPQFKTKPWHMIASVKSHIMKQV